VERRLQSTNNRTVWDLVVVLGVLIVGAGVGFWLSEQRNAARYHEVDPLISGTRSVSPTCSIPCSISFLRGVSTTLRRSLDTGTKRRKPRSYSANGGSQEGFALS
jgi:hypothetical protein